MYEINHVRSQDIESAMRRPAYKVDMKSEVPDVQLIKSIVKNAPIPNEPFPPSKKEKPPAEQKPITKPKKPAKNDNILDILRQVQGNVAGTGPQKGDPALAPQVNTFNPNPGYVRPVRPGLIMPRTLEAQPMTRNDFTYDNDEEEDFE